MCLGIPGQLVELFEGGCHLARVEVSGVTRVVDVALLDDVTLQPGDWVLIHVGFALSKIDEHEAELARATLELMGQAYDDEVAALLASRIAEGLREELRADAATTGTHRRPPVGSAGMASTETAGDDAPVPAG